MSIEPTPSTRRRAARAAEPDLVDRIMEVFIQNAPEMQPRARELEGAVRDQLAGGRYWVRKVNANRPDLAELVFRHFNGRNVSEVARTLKISRATVYRVLRVPATSKVSAAAFSETKTGLACRDGSNSD